jgi:hypothetical protein
MKTKGSISSSRGSMWAVGALATLLVAATPAFAQHSGGGGGGGHGGGGGGGHASMGGGHAGFSGGRAGFAGGRAGYAGGAHYAPRGGYAGYRGGSVGGRVSSVSGYRGGYAGGAGYRGGIAGHAGYGYGYGRGGFGWNRPYWGGGYWHGGFWPRAYYGWGYPWFLGVLPAVYATYWWGGIPYYYANDVYYTWNAGQSGYVVTDPPPADASGDNSGAPADGSYESADPGNGGAPAPSANGIGGGGGDIYAYPKNGQTDEQQATDRYECHKWAVAQSGFDPTHTSNNSGNSGDYRRAMGACLDGRGYSSK